jgi:hypothetical protein
MPFARIRFFPTAADVTPTPTSQEASFREWVVRMCLAMLLSVAEKPAYWTKRQHPENRFDGPLHTLLGRLAFGVHEECARLS